MIKVVGKQEIDGVMYYAVLDEEDESVEVVPAEIIKRVSSMGMTMGGVVVKDADGNFDVTEEFFFKQEDYEYNDSDFESNEQEASEDEEEFDDWGYEDEAEADAESEDDEYTPLEAEDESEYDEEDSYEEVDEYFEDEWITEEEEAMSEVDKLYAMLNAEQSSLLKRYYLWTSQIMFENSAGKGVARLQLKNTPKALKKQSEIDALRGTGKEWVYAGYLDVGEDHCSLCGARLRYMHFICDAAHADTDDMFWGNSYENIDFSKLNSAIEAGKIFTFGIECTSDFFDISSEELDAIKKNQADSINEMKVMYKMMLSPKSYENAKNSLKIFEIMMDSIAKSVARSKLFKSANRFETPLISFYTQFKNSGMLYPRSLVLRLWSTFMRYEYPRRYNRSLSIPMDTTREMISCYTERARKSLSDEDKQIVRDIITDDKTYASVLGKLCNYTDNLLLIQFQGIYCYNPYTQKDIDGVFDSPRNRDLGGSNANSKYYYQKVTGVSDSDYRGSGLSNKVPEYYEGYPQCYCMPRVDNIWGVGTDFFTFAPEEVLKMMILTYLKSVVKCVGSSYNIADSVARSIKIGSLKSEKNAEGLVVWDYNPEVNVGTYDIREVVSQLIKNMPAEFNLDMEVENVDREFVIGDKERSYYKIAVADIDEAIAVIKSAKGISDKRSAYLTQAVYDYYEERKNELNAKEKTIFDEKKAAEEAIAKQEAEEEARRAEVAEKLKELQEEAESSSQPSGEGISISGLRFSGVSPDSIDCFDALLSKVKDKGFNSLGYSDKSDASIKAVFEVIEANPILVSLCNATNTLYMDIISTVKRTGRISPNQRYHLVEAMRVVFTTLSSNEGSEGTEEKATEPEAIAPVEFIDPKGAEIVKEAETAKEIVVEQPEEKSAEVTVPKKQDEVIDIRKDESLKAKFNALVANSSTLGDKMSARDMMNLGNIMRRVKMTYKVTQRQREAIEAAYALLQ